jgi:hypothetical protein
VLSSCCSRKDRAHQPLTVGLANLQTPHQAQEDLVSAHTQGTWPLGDIQEWVAASLLGDTGRAERALVRLLAVAAPDGLLPETYDSATGRWPDSWYG